MPNLAFILQGLTVAKMLRNDSVITNSGMTQTDTELYMDKWTKQAKNYCAYYRVTHYLYIYTKLYMNK